MEIEIWLDAEIQKLYFRILKFPGESKLPNGLYEAEKAFLEIFFMDWHDYTNK